MSGEQRWEGRPWAARAVSFIAMAGPLLVAVLVTSWLGRRLPAPGSMGTMLALWLLLGAVAVGVVIVLGHLARRLLPFAALLKLSLAFPGTLPSRYRIARVRGGSRHLQAEVDHAREHGLSDDRTEAAMTVLQLVAALSAHDSATRGHAERVRVFVDLIAEELDLAPGDVDRLRWASLLHDIGKLVVHQDVLNEPGSLSADDWEVMRTHPLEGARIAAPLEPWLGEWSKGIEQHHERWDGHGYPYGLSRKQLSLAARIVAVADAYDVMTAARAYKPTVSAAAAREELARHAGTQFDPAIVRAFLAIPLQRLWWAVGPVSWLASTPLGRPLRQGSGGASAVAAAAVAATVVGGLAGGPGVTLPDRSTEVAGVALDARDGQEAPTEEAGPAAASPPAAPSGVPGPPATPPPTPDAPTRSPVPAPTPSPDGESAPSSGGTPSTSTPTTEQLVPLAPGRIEVTDDEATIHEDGVLTIDVLANDRAAPGRTLRLRDALAPVGQTAWDPDGVVTWRPRTNFAGTTSLTYLVTDGTQQAVGVVTIVVTPVNDPPVLADDIATVDEDTPQVIDLLGDDIDPDGDELRLVALDVGPAPLGSVRDNGDGTVTYTPDPGASGLHTVVYTVTDGTVEVRATLDVVIVAVDDPPLPGADTATVDEDATVTVDVLANDVDPDGDALSVVAVDLPRATTDVVDGTVVVAPVADVNGRLTGTVTVGDGRSTATSDLTVVVLPVNDPPTISAGADVRIASGAGAVTVPGWATGITPGPADEAGQVLTATVTTDRPDLFSHGPSLDPGSGDLVVGAAGTPGTATATIRLTDDGGTARGGSDTTVVVTTIEVVATGGPVAIDDRGEVDEDRTLVIDVLANDTDPEGGRLTIVDVDRRTGLGQVVPVGGGQLRYVPGPDEYGTDTFTYTVSNGVGTATATVTIEVLPTPDAPVAGDDAYVTTVATPLDVGAASGVLANDSDEDGDELVVDTSATAAPPAADGVLALAADGSFTFTPAADFSGTTTFQYRVTDGSRSDRGLVTITVLPAWGTTALHLTGAVRDATTSSLSPDAPAAADPPPDWDGDGLPGLTIAASTQDLGESDPGRFHDWAMTTTSDLVLAGPVELVLTSATVDAGPVRVDYTVGLYECAGACTLLASSADVHVEQWSTGGAWTTRSLPIGSVSETIEAGNTIRVRLLVGHADIQIALTGDRSSSLLLRTPA